jgi:hypothetical protein
MKKEYERLQKRARDTAETLIHELGDCQTEISADMAQLLTDYYNLHSTYFSEVLNLLLC